MEDHEISRQVAIYCGNAAGRDKDAALRSLRSIAGSESWTIAGVFVDEGGRSEQGVPSAWHRLRSLVETGKVDMVAVPSLAAMGRSVSDVLGEILWLRKHRCDLYVDDAGLNTASPVDQVLFTVAAALKAVDDTAVPAAKKSATRRQNARPRQPALTPYQESVLRAAISSGLSLAEVARSLKLPPATVRAFAKGRKP